MSDDNKPPEYAEDGWESVLDNLSAKDEATMNERMRCELLVRAEIEQGHARGVPESAGVMIILHRIALAISNG